MRPQRRFFMSGTQARMQYMVPVRLVSLTVATTSPWRATTWGSATCSVLALTMRASAGIASRLTARTGGIAVVSRM